MTNTATQMITRNGMTLPELAETLKAHRATMRDFKLPSNQASIALGGDINTLQVQMPDRMEQFQMNEVFHKQIATHYEIPQKYYERIRQEKPDLFVQTVNSHLAMARDKDGSAEKRMIRTAGGTARGFLSAGYRPLDNADLLIGAVLPALSHIQMDNLRFDCQVTDTRMYIKITYPLITGEIRVGDVVEAGVIIKNSEVGFSSVSVEPFVNRLVCANGLVLPDYRYRKYHAGSKAGSENLVYAQELMSDRTKLLKDATVWSEVQDLIKGTLTQESFDRMLEPMRRSAGIEIERPVDTVVEEVGSMFSLNQDEMSNMLDNLAKGNDMTQWGLVNAVTALAHGEDSYDRATELQEIGGKILTDSRVVALLKA